MKRLILASASPRRRQILEQAGFDFEIIVSGEDEDMEPAGPEETVKQLSRQKGLSVEKRVEGDAAIIAADTVVAIDGRILGKPADEQEALEMLRALQGRVHQVYTGVCIIENENGQRKEHVFAQKTDVELYPMSDQQILSYIAKGECLDKAGAYAIQGSAAVYVKAISGDYYNVVGLPVASIWQYFNSCN